jgi:ribonuclease VapC
MILDTSAIIAILRNETEASVFAKAVEEAAHRRISAVNYVEAAAVIDGSRDPIASRRFDDLLREAQVASSQLLKLRPALHARLTATSAREVAIRPS